MLKLTLSLSSFFPVPWYFGNNDDDRKDDELLAPAFLPSFYFHLVVKPQNDSFSQLLKADKLQANSRN